MGFNPGITRLQPWGSALSRLIAQAEVSRVETWACGLDICRMPRREVFAPRGLEESAQGFNPGNHPERRALKGRQIKRNNNVKARSNRSTPQLHTLIFSRQSVRDISGQPLAPSGLTRLFRSIFPTNNLAQCRMAFRYSRDFRPAIPRS
jgi:hypothetical protein